MVNAVEEIKKTVINLLSTVLSTRKENLIVTIKKIQKNPNGGYFVLGNYRKTEFLEESSGSFQVEFDENLEVESLEI
jgi:hypothetical protein